MTWRILPALLTLLILAGCSASDYGATLPASPAGNQQTADDPCVVNGQTYCVLNPQVVQGTISQTICVKGWTATVRPPVSYTDPIKRRQMAQGVNVRNGDHRLADYELDHRMPLALGGSPADENNLSLEFADAPIGRDTTHNRKDDDEVAFQHRVCSGEPLRHAQAEFVQRWMGPYPSYRQ